MKNTIEAAEMIEERIVTMEVLLAQQKSLKDAMVDNNVDITDMDRIIKAGEEVIATHKESIRIIKDSLNE